PYDRSTGASRSTTLMGLAVQEACRDLRQQLLEIASALCGRPAAHLSFEEGEVLGPDQVAMPYGDLIRRFYGMDGGELIGRGYVRPATGGDRLTARPIFWEVAWGAAEVGVDRETGEVQVRRYVSAADVGKAINPLLAEGQDEGAAMMGIGHTLYEALRNEGGQVLNANLVDYRVPLITDLPDEFVTILVEEGNGPGAFGAKGMGEGAINPVAPAVAAAVARACGVRITELPLTAERVWRALRQQAARAGAPVR
ncbi:MAG: xanthine dehydrogenase family protein molybdopterin-binding subunit, partial [bacterium]